MLPLVFDILKANSALTALVSGRIYRHGNAPQNVVKPYVTWFVVMGMPELQISGTPCSDMDTVQIDCWSDTDTQVESVALAVRNALDNAGVANRVIQNNREDETRLFRIGFEADFITSR
jgi:hypothetical protein